MSAALRRSLSSLAVPNYRRYFPGQVISLAGNWMQIVAETWLVLKLTNNLMHFGNKAFLYQALELAGAFGVDETKALELWSQGSGDSWVVRVRGCRLSGPPG